MANPVELIGAVAGVLTTLAFLPQLIHTFRTKSVDDLNLGALVTFDVGLVLWLIYGLAHHSAPIIWANVVTLAFQLGILYLKLRYRTTKQAQEDEATSPSAR
ncbi:MAG TPA: SemiSWEET transporter [candidate division Zixibacteria bacterium]|nr:SemiSWEET transporter [candidate division Zixibacteria bacterium]